MYMHMYMHTHLRVEWLWVKRAHCRSIVPHTISPLECSFNRFDIPNVSHHLYTNTFPAHVGMGE